MADRQFYSADPAGGLYNPLAYYVATTAANTLVTIANGLIITLIVYGMAGMRWTTQRTIVPKALAQTGCMLWPASLEAGKVVHAGERRGICSAWLQPLCLNPLVKACEAQA